MTGTPWPFHACCSRGCWPVRDDPTRQSLQRGRRWRGSNGGAATTPAYADAECELGRAQVLQGAIPEGRAALERCLPIYRAWGLADREVVRSLERLLADS